MSSDDTSSSSSKQTGDPTNSASVEGPATRTLTVDQVDWTKAKPLGINYKGKRIWSVGEPSLTRDQIDRLLGLTPKK